MIVEEYILTDNTKSYRITAEGDKVLQRKSDGLVMGTSVILGYTYYINGNLLNVPRLELPEDYEEVDIPAEDNESVEHKKRNHHA